MADGGDQRPERPSGIGLYKLIGHEPVPVADMAEWAVWFDEADRVVRSTTLGPWWVSTVFLGMDHNFLRAGPPLLFETMVFKLNRHNAHRADAFDCQARQSTWDDAVRDHRWFVAQVARVKSHKWREARINGLYAP